MDKYFLAVMVILLSAGTVLGETKSQLSISNNGWTVTIDSQQSVVTISYERLGAVLKDVRLNLQGDRGLLPLKEWSIEKKNENLLSVATAHPETAWLFETGLNM